MATFGALVQDRIGTFTNTDLLDHTLTAGARIVIDLLAVKEEALLEYICGECNTTIQPNDHFCSKCGLEFESVGIKSCDEASVEQIKPTIDTDELEHEKNSQV